MRKERQPLDGRALFVEDGAKILESTSRKGVGPSDREEHAMCMYDHSTDVVIVYEFWFTFSRIVDYSDDLGLSTAQLNQVIAINKAGRQEHAQYLVQMKALGDQLDQLLLQHHPDANQAYALIDQRTALTNAMARRNIDRVVEVGNILTPQQAVALRQIYDNEEAVFDTTPYLGIG